jgi:glycosyltransferase involved in cell wall biosynthesis
MTNRTGAKASVSVLIPNLNHGRFLGQCLESVLGQTVQPLEILIGDGGSTDGSLDILDMYAKTHPDLVRVFKLKLSVNPTLELLVRESKGEFVAFLGSDDYWDPRFIEETTKAIGSSCVAYANLYAVWPGQTKEWRLPDHDPAILKRSNYVSLNAALIRRDVLGKMEELGGGRLFDGSMGIPSDWDLFLRMTPLCTFVHVPKPLTYYRRHRQQTTSKLAFQYSVFLVFRRYNRVTLPAIFKIIFVGTLVPLLRMYRLHRLADFALTPFYAKPVNDRDY